MGVRVAVGAVLSAVVLMAWAFVFWAVLSPPGGQARAVPDEPALLAELLQRLPESGTYFFPLPPAPQAAHGAALEAFRQRNLAGPVGMIHFNRQGHDPLAVATYLPGLLHLLVASLLAAVLLRVALPVLGAYAQRVAFVVGLGVFAAVAVRLADPVWWHLPWEHFLHGALYDVSGWLIAGLVLGAVVKPQRGARHYTDSKLPLWRRALDVD